MVILHYGIFLALALVAVANGITITIHDAIAAGTVTVSCSFNGQELGSQDLASGRRYNVQFPDEEGKKELVWCSFRRGHDTYGHVAIMHVKLWDVPYGGGPAPCQSCDWFVRDDGLYFQSSLYTRWP